MKKEESIHFFKEKVLFRFSKKEQIIQWLSSTASKEGFKIRNLNYIFCSDAHILKMNKDYLGHNYFTDIITFDNGIEKKIIEGDIYISVDTVKNNSVRFNTTFNDELHRVMIHGLLHLLGYKDKKENEKSKMRMTEDKYLAYFKSKY